MLVMIAHYDCLVEDDDMGFTYITLRDNASVIRNHWGDRIQNFKVLDLLRDSQIYVGPVRLLREIRVGGISKKGTSFAYWSKQCTKYFDCPRGRMCDHITPPFS